jgi:hypothetical protein
MERATVLTEELHEIMMEPVTPWAEIHDKAEQAAGHRREPSAQLTTEGGLMADGEIDFTAFGVEIMQDLVTEMRGRFVGFESLPQQDRDAIVTAIGKASWRGILRGAALYGQEFNEAVQALRAEDPDFPDVKVNTRLEITGNREPDLWADKYGESG